MTKTDKIIQKLPIETKKMFSSPFIMQEEWTPEWDKWAKNTLEMCIDARDHGVISSIEWQHLRNKFFGKLGGVIGERPYCDNLNFMAFLYYDYVKNETTIPRTEEI